MAKTKHIAVRDLGKVQAHVRRIVDDVQTDNTQTLLARIAELEAELAAAKADTARLDFVTSFMKIHWYPANGGFWADFMNPVDGFYVRKFDASGDTPREAIDNAMEAK